MKCGYMVPVDIVYEYPPGRNYIPYSPENMYLEYMALGAVGSWVLMHDVFDYRLNIYRENNLEVCEHDFRRVVRGSIDIDQMILLSKEEIAWFEERDREYLTEIQSADQALFAAEIEDLIQRDPDLYERIVPPLLAGDGIAGQSTSNPSQVVTPDDPIQAPPPSITALPSPSISSLAPEVSTTTTSTAITSRATEVTTATQAVEDQMPEYAGSLKY